MRILICIYVRTLYIACLSQEGLTPLHLAALYGSEEIVRILVQEFQMDPDIADSVSKTFIPSYAGDHNTILCSCSSRKGDGTDCTESHWDTWGQFNASDYRSHVRQSN